MHIFGDDLNIDAISMKQLVQFAETKAVTANILKEFFVSSLLEQDNVLAQVCERTSNIGDSLKALVLEDLSSLWSGMSGSLLEGYVPSARRELFFVEYQQSLSAIVESDTPSKMMDALISHYSAFGSGKNAQYVAFKWQNGLRGVKTPDDISLDQLFCLESQKEELLENTISFLRGLPANNALLYGDSGSGKSSMVKALLNKYYKDGLRLAEIPKAALDELPQLVNCIKNKRFKYLIFMDDLSFENNDIGYKNLKRILEGQIEKLPQNILIYATSNRFHIVNESWKERQGDDVHVRDTRNEKLSLSDRFGIRIGFYAPNQDDYLRIIEGLLARHDITLSDEVRAEAIKWELSHGGRSGRTAAQFAKTILSSRNKMDTNLLGYGSP
jgi:predicted AAA+ superfamily ATPase